MMPLGGNAMSRFAVLAVLSILAPASVAAQGYPAKPIHLILPYVPGGIIDTAGRHLALRLSESLVQSVVAENRPGAGGVVGTDVVARSAADGYTILLTDPALVSNPSLLPDAPYDLSALQPVSIVGSSPAVIVANPQLPVKNFGELIAYAKANPGKLNFASAGIGTAPHLAGEMIKLRTGIAMQHVPYRGIGAAYPDVMSGKVQLAISSIAGAVPFTTDNRVRPLATTRSVRSSVYPDVPTVAESGLPGFDVDLWIGIYAPAGLPQPVLARLNSEINKVLQHPELKAAFAKIGVEPRGTTPEDAAAYTRSEFEKWKKVIADGKIKPE
jgi:tripartite-type tricarboxylate transporter receptor subunit TctC